MVEKDKNLFGEDIEEYDPKSLDFFNGLGTIVEKDNTQMSFFDYLWNRKSKD